MLLFSFFDRVIFKYIFILAAILARSEHAGVGLAGDLRSPMVATESLQAHRRPAAYDC